MYFLGNCSTLTDQHQTLIKECLEDKDKKCLQHCFSCLWLHPSKKNIRVCSFLSPCSKLMNCIFISLIPLNNYCFSFAIIVSTSTRIP